MHLRQDVSADSTCQSKPSVITGLSNADMSFFTLGLRSASFSEILLGTVVVCPEMQGVDFQVVSFIATAFRVAASMVDASDVPVQ